MRVLWSFIAFAIGLVFLFIVALMVKMTREYPDYFMNFWSIILIAIISYIIGSVILELFNVKR